MIDSLMKEIGIEGSSLGRMSDVIRDAKDLTSIAQGDKRGGEKRGEKKAKPETLDDDDD
jgi:hypothetical protein